MTALGSTIERLRKERGWTQGKLAVHSGVSQSHISKIERHEFEDVSARVVAQLAHALEVSADYLCEEADWLPNRPHPKELALAEYRLITAIRSLGTPRLRQKVLEQLTWIAETVVNAEQVEELKKIAEGRSTYEDAAS